MSGERWQELDRVFTEALRLPAAERRDFVAQRCGGDQALIADAIGLLEADRACAEFMAKPALDRLAESMAAEGWDLEPGERIGAYVLVDLLGAGGAGQVWRARDERLGRDVAIKTLLPHFSSDSEQLRRFADEARTAGALNHSNILTVHDVGEHRGRPFLVSECLEGQSLRKRIAHGPIAPDEAVAVALDIARGLVAAHARGIVHRDLKPENVFLRSDGGAKILDFGLAKLQSASGSLKDSQTMTGVIVGTAGYMAPEQVKGETVDARADLFALGVILFEMLATHPFRRSNAIETVHAVITVDPPDLATVGEKVPYGLSRIVMRLLRKAPEARFQSAIDLVWALEQHAGRSSEVAASAATPRVGGAASGAGRLALAGVAVAVAVVIAAVSLMFGWWRVPPASGLTQLTIELPDGIALGSAPTVSPDGRTIAFVGTDGSRRRLFVRALGSREAQAVPGTEGALDPFWSPDSRSLGFFARRQLMRVAWPGGSPVPLAEAPFGHGASWGRAGNIVFAPDVILEGLRRVPAGGGGVEPATVLELELGDTSHWWPHFLPDGVHFLYLVRSTADARRGVYLGGGDRSTSRASTFLFRSDSEAVYAPLDDGRGGVLFYLLDGRTEARRFDPKRLDAAAEARTIGISAGASTLHHAMTLSASADVLAFSESPIATGDRLEWVRRDGERLRLWSEHEAQNWPRFSPDGKRVARQRVHPVQNGPDLWVEDLERGTMVRVTTGPEPDLQPVWSPDGERLAYVSGHLPGRTGERKLRIAAADGTGVEREMRCPASYCEPTDWAVDRDHLLVNVNDAGAEDVWIVSATGDGEARPLLTATFAERDARFSPDGRWIAYVSEESGRPEVSVRAIAETGPRVVVSSGGGGQPVWRRDGAELFFVAPSGRLQSVGVRWNDGAPKFERAAALPVPPVGFGHWGTQYDVSPDGGTFIGLRHNDDPARREIHVVIGWRELVD